VLVGPGWLRERVGHADVRIVDLREADAHGAGHIPGAVHLELAELGSKVGACDNVLLPPDEFAALMSRLGISNGSSVLAYDDQWGLAAARLLWALHRYGHAAVAVLDGGWERWIAEGGASTTDTPRPQPGTFTPAPREDVFADHAWIAARSADGSATLLDTRAPGELARGHIPGAVGWDWFNAVPPGSWEATRAPADIRAELASLGVDPVREVAVYCRSGMRAAHTYMVLRHAGFERVRLYDGSWQEWAAHLTNTEK
jgi:thiosulfate/3-mercaptopyruvate sulfurtransferase